jgi:hypothetical protein
LQEWPKDTDGNEGHIMICCFCGNEISLDEILALRMKIENIERTSRNAPGQELYAHDYCFQKLLHSSVPFDSEALAD